MRILCDMNLPPAWVDFLREHGIDATHWSEVGDWRAPDADILRWSRERKYVVFTHDLDFGNLLGMTREAGPSVIQVRTQDVTSEAIGTAVLSAIEKHGTALAQGAIVTIQMHSSRVRVLPIHRQD